MLFSLSVCPNLPFEQDRDDDDQDDQYSRNHDSIC